MNKGKKFLAIALTIAQITMLLTGCGGGKSAATKDAAQAKDASSGEVTAQAKDAGTRDILNVGVIDENWVGTDLIQSDTFYDIQMLIAEPLFLYNQDTGELQGCLASTPEFSADGKTMTFEIPKGLKFPSGADLDAGDVKASLEWGKAEGSMSDVFNTITNIETQDNKVIVTMKEFSTALMILLVSPFFCVIDKDQLSSMSKEELLWGAQPFGAYYVTDYAEGGYVTLERNQYYKTNNPYLTNKGIANIPKVKINFVQDEFNAIAGLTTGEFDLVINLSSDGNTQASAMKGVTVSSSLPPMVRNLQMNCTSDKLTDKNVRLAIALLINRDNIVQAFGGLCEPAYSYITKNVMFHTDETDEYFKQNYANNVDKAKQLLATAGYSDSDGDGYLDKDGKAFELNFVTASGKNETAAIAIQMQLQDAGIKINLETTDDANDRMAKKDYDLGICSYWWSEPSRFLQKCFKDTGNFDTTEYLNMCNQVGSVVDNKERLQLVDKTQKYLMDTMSLVPLYTTTYVKAYTDNLSDILFIRDGLFINDCK
jgi:ABC-type dipeptide transport system, periplasmic component